MLPLFQLLDPPVWVINLCVYFRRTAKYQPVSVPHYFLEMTKYSNYFKQRCLGLKLYLMLKIHVRQVYSTYSSLLTVTKKTN